VAARVADRAGACAAYFWIGAVTVGAKSALTPSVGLPAQPYPGLRPFDPDEHRIFFGREEMVDAVIDGLSENNLVVVHGASGSGKSSLVRAGVLPWLAIQQSGRRKWLTGIRRPAGGPLRNIAAVLAALLGAPPGFDDATDAARFWHMRLALGPAVLSDIEAALSDQGASLCLLIDQFEELFRFAKEKSREEAELLTQLLRSLARQENPAPHLFIILTMRSDYVGECARFEGFAETVNDCQYLLPRLDDFGILRAIHEPAMLYGGTVEPAVGDRLLFTARREEDALPILQHALMRACAYARKRHGSGEGWTVTLSDLEFIEGKQGALSQHADEVLTEFSAGDPIRLKAVESLFRRLTELDAEGRIIRHPCRFADLVAVAGGDRAAVAAAIQAFQASGRNFLTSSPPGLFEADTEIDVSHEALIRRWRLLSDATRDSVTNEPVGWIWREFEDGQRWRALAVQARMFRDDKSKGATLSPATTEAYEAWWPEHTAAWAVRHARSKALALEEYREVEELWRASKKALELERTRLKPEQATGTEQIALLLQGVGNWNLWRGENPDVCPDLQRANFTEADLAEVNLSNANLVWTNFREANLAGAKLQLSDLRAANLSRANLSNADISSGDLTQADLQGARLRQTILARARLRQANLMEADLTDADLTEANLHGANLTHANLARARFNEANLREADLSGANLRDADLSQADLSEVKLTEANLRGANLHGANLTQANLRGANLNGANLTQANLSVASLVEANLTNADLTGCRIYGVSAWSLDLTGTKQQSLVITPPNESEVTIDNIEVAQFVFLLLHNEKIRDVIDPIGNKGVLLLGRFTEDRIEILNRLAEKLRSLGFVPMVFNLDKPQSRDFTETIRLLANLSHFAIIDITNPRSMPLELQAIVPDYMIPFVTILQEGEEPFAMFADLQRYDWVLKPLVYPSVDRLLELFEDVIVRPAEAKFKELQARRARKLRVETL
jgi:uncharacterized protein YjbI with pentapeptide repeats